jgi:hypothetical protein
MPKALARVDNANDHRRDGLIVVWIWQLSLLAAYDGMEDRLFYQRGPNKDVCRNAAFALSGAASLVA